MKYMNNEIVAQLKKRTEMSENFHQNFLIQSASLQVNKINIMQINFWQKLV